MESVIINRVAGTVRETGENAIDQKQLDAIVEAAANMVEQRQQRAHRLDAQRQVTPGSTRWAGGASSR